MMLRCLAALALAGAATAVHSPVFSWSSQRNSRGDGVKTSSSRFDRSDLLEHVRAWADQGLSRGSRDIHLLLMDELHAETLTALATSGDAATASVLSGVSSQIVKQASALVVSKALLHDNEQAASGRLRDQLASTVETAGCSLTYVADGDADAPAGAAVLSRTQYMSMLESQQEQEQQGGPSCRAFVVALKSSAMVQELGLLASATRRASADRDHFFVFTADAAPAPAHHAADDAAEAALAAAPRFLQQSGSGSAATAGLVYGNIAMQPEIVAGLLVGALLLFVVWVGISCTLSVRAPDVMHSTTLPAGKEY